MSGGGINSPKQIHKMCGNNDCIPKIYIFQNPELPGLILMYSSRSIPNIVNRCALSLGAGRIGLNTEAIRLENCYGNRSSDQRKTAIFSSGFMHHGQQQDW
jgi:hypothetical protein